MILTVKQVSQFFIFPKLLFTINQSILFIQLVWGGGGGGGRPRLAFPIYFLIYASRNA